MKGKNAIDAAMGNRLIDLRSRITSNFSEGNWEELGLLTGATDTINNHHRLLRSLAWNDEDYDGNALSVLRQIVEEDARTLSIIEAYVDKRFPGESQYISAKPSERKITFSPHVFDVPDGFVEFDLVAAMMPFSKEFSPVHEANKHACAGNALRCLRADDIWEDATIIQDIFNLVFRAQVVIVDFTGKNPNVMYETGIAHTLGKHVIPITQSLDDVPFDTRHHRALKYLPNTEGLITLANALTKKLSQFCPKTIAPEPPVSDDDPPF